MKQLHLPIYSYHKLLYFSSNRMIPYGCLSTGSSIGMIEVVHQAETIAKLQKKKGMTAVFAKECIWNWFKDYHSTEDE